MNARKSGDGIIDMKTVKQRDDDDDDDDDVRARCQTKLRQCPLARLSTVCKRLEYLKHLVNRLSMKKTIINDIATAVGDDNDRWYDIIRTLREIDEEENKTESSKGNF